MRKRFPILFIFAAVAFVCLGDEVTRNIITTAFTRGFLKVNSQGEAQTYLGISGGGGVGESNVLVSAANNGAQLPAVPAKSGTNLLTKSIVSGSGITIATNSTNITISSTYIPTPPGGIAGTVQVNNPEEGFENTFIGYDEYTYTHATHTIEVNDFTFNGDGNSISGKTNSVSIIAGSAGLSSAQITTGIIVTTSLFNAGTGYDLQVYDLDGGSGNDAQITVTGVDVNGAITSYTISNPGQQNLVNDVLTVIGGGGDDASITVDSVTCSSDNIAGTGVFLNGGKSFGNAGSIVTIQAATNNASCMGINNVVDAWIFGATNTSVLDIDRVSRTEVFTSGGALFTHASPVQRTVPQAEWLVMSGSTVTTNINGKSTGDTTLYTVPSGKQLVVERILIIPTTIVSLTTVPTVSIGKTGASYIDVVAASALTGLSATTKVVTLSPILASTLLDAGEVLKLHVDATLTAATTYTFKAVVVGVLLNQ